jgi:hypothetical protein
MFATWYSGDARDRYRISSHKSRIDLIGGRLVQQRYLDEAIRRHLHEWLRFTDDVDQSRLSRPPSLTDDAVRTYVAARARGKSASLGRFVRASIRIFLDRRGNDARDGVATRLGATGGAVYSVPCRWAGLDLVVRIGATTVTIVGRDGRPVAHPRKRFGQRSIDYRHYLPELARKPAAPDRVQGRELRRRWISRSCCRQRAACARCRW